MKDMNGTANMEATMKTLVAILLLTACAVAQNVGKPKTATISASFSKAAVRYLVTVMRPVASGAIASQQAFVDAEASASSKAEEKMLEALHEFDVTHAMNLEVVEMEHKVYVAYVEAARASGMTPAAEEEKPHPDLDKDEACYKAWKISLQTLSAAQPAICEAK
jgi:hypothetical protein